MPEGPMFVTVRDLETGHHYDVREDAVRPGQQVLPQHGRSPRPRRAKHYLDLQLAGDQPATDTNGVGTAGDQVLVTEPGPAPTRPARRGRGAPPTTATLAIGTDTAQEG